MKRFLTTAGVAGIVLLGLAGPALGHAELVSAEPADGSTVGDFFAGPIVLVFDEALADGSSAALTTPSGTVVIANPDPDDPTRIVIDGFQDALMLGEYTVEWTSVGADGDIERGTVRFTVTEAPTPTGAPPTETPTETPTAAPSPTATPAPGDGGSGNTSDVILPIVVGLIVVALVAWRLLRRGSTGS